MTDLKPVIVMWDDHCGGDSNWKPNHEYDNKLLHITSCGYLLKEDKTAMTLVLSSSVNDMSSAYITIGKKLVTEIIYLQARPKNKWKKK